LSGLALDRVKDRAQHGMPLYDGMESPGQGIDMEWTDDPEDARYVVGCGAGIKLVEKP